MLKYFNDFPFEDTGVSVNVAFLTGVVSCVLGIALSLMGVRYWWDFLIATGAVIVFSMLSFAIGKSMGEDEGRRAGERRREKTD